MTKIEELLESNEKFLKSGQLDYSGEDVKSSKKPKKQLAIVTCMDTRLVEFLEPALGIKRGDAKIIKTAGNVLVDKFDTTIRSLLVCIYELGVKEIAIIGHHECGMAKTSAASLKEAMLERGIRPEAIEMVSEELTTWADSFKKPEENVMKVVKTLREHPLIAKDVQIHGLMIHPRSGKVELLI